MAKNTLRNHIDDIRARLWIGSKVEVAHAGGPFWFVWGATLWILLFVALGIIVKIAFGG